MSCPFCAYSRGHEPGCLGAVEVTNEDKAALAAQREETLDEQFAEFHAANPQVYEELVRLARKAAASGHRRLGVGMLWEVMRWNALFRVAHGETEFKLNNNFRSRYARLVMEREPDLTDVFETRELTSLRTEAA